MKIVKSMHYNNTWTITNIEPDSLINTPISKEQILFSRHVTTPGIVKRAFSSSNQIDHAYINPSHMCIIRIYPGNKVTDLSSNLKKKSMNYA